MIRILSQLSVIVFSLLEFATSKLNEEPSPSYQLSFGSCFKYPEYGQGSTEIFHSIYQKRPNSFLWLGDFAYLDDMVLTGHVPNNITEVKKRLDESYLDPNYTLLRKSENIKILGIWDDHDYGINDGDKHNEQKEVIRQLFLDAMDEPKDSPRRTNPNGIYFSTYLHPKIKLILLDNRYENDGYSLKDSFFEMDKERCNLGKK